MNIHFSQPLCENIFKRFSKAVDDRNGAVSMAIGNSVSECIAGEFFITSYYHKKHL